MAAPLYCLPQQAQRAPWFVETLSSILAHAIFQRTNTVFDPRIIASSYLEMRNSNQYHRNLRAAETQLSTGLMHIIQQLNALDHHQLTERLNRTVHDAVGFLPIPIRDVITTEPGVVESFAQQLGQMLSDAV